ncbi:hypothetical protein DEU56DRAFT_759399 [Suillus clintonianus]|uniref:uncharacterized protein n=1 Tax=Suillus clintonianus TaxID=1904413 RepID=UPI001B86598B|nr:uncharacterized protein DEU56DRAFT_759399 [Suillus clintonianus]KAG2125157.1 hypothetical protein DEU56DRAFT_759399 [Suillus clintonianus]
MCKKLVLRPDGLAVLDRWWWGGQWEVCSGTWTFLTLGGADDFEDRFPEGQQAHCPTRMLNSSLTRKSSSHQRAHACTQGAFHAVFGHGPAIELDSYVMYHAQFEYGRLLARPGDKDAARQLVLQNLLTVPQFRVRVTFQNRFPTYTGGYISFTIAAVGKNSFLHNNSIMSNQHSREALYYQNSPFLQDAGITASLSPISVTSFHLSSCPRPSKNPQDCWALVIYRTLSP